MNFVLQWKPFMILLWWNTIVSLERLGTVRFCGAPWWPTDQCALLLEKSVVTTFSAIINEWSLNFTQCLSMFIVARVNYVCTRNWIKKLAISHKTTHSGKKVEWIRKITPSWGCIVKLFWNLIGKSMFRDMSSVQCLALVYGWSIKAWYHWCTILFRCGTVHIRRYNVKSHGKVQGRNSAPE